MRSLSVAQFVEPKFLIEATSIAQVRDHGLLGRCRSLVVVGEEVVSSVESRYLWMLFRLSWVGGRAGVEVKPGITARDR